MFCAVLFNMNKYVFIPYDKYQSLVASKKTNVQDGQHTVVKVEDKTLHDNNGVSTNGTGDIKTQIDDGIVQNVSENQRGEQPSLIKFSTPASLLPPPPGVPDTDAIFSDMVNTL